ncbi:MAG: ROK family protein [Helicobacteraceae bacterium]|jgi:glucokinase|nr:ROK family protein [Helicobacteraceae bacterium]
MKLVFDIGGTRLRRGVLDDRGAFVLLDSRPNAGNLKTALEALIAETLAEYPIGFIGASIAAQTRRNKIASAPNMELGALKDEDFSVWIKRRFSVNAAIDNDLKCVALAEAAARSNVASLFALFIGTGIGGAYVENGALIRGADNNAGEIGHIPFEKAPFLCGCGGAECLELSASGSGLAKWSEYYGLKEQKLSDLIESTDPKASEIVDRFYRGVDRAIKTIAALFNPRVIALGGGAVMANESVLLRAKEALKSAFAPCANIAIGLSSLGDKANLLGASFLDS